MHKLTSRLLAVAAVAATAACGTADNGEDPRGTVASPIGTASASASFSPPASAYKEFRRPVAIDRVWPQAVVRIPKKLPGGESFRPLEILDDQTLLIRLEDGQALTYDLTKRRTSKIAVVPEQEWTVSAAEGHLAWWTQEGRQVSAWAVPLSGGQPFLVASFPGTPDPGRFPVEGFSLSGGKLRWSTTSGVYEAPLRPGAAVTAVPGSQGHHIVLWPWISPEWSNRVIVNAETGERRTAAVDSKEISLVCGIVWCYDKSQAMTRDGSRTVPFSTSGPDNQDVPERDRFILGATAGTDATIIIDLDTGRTGSIPFDVGARGYVHSPQSRMFAQEVEDGYLLVDLKKV